MKITSLCVFVSMALGTLFSIKGMKASLVDDSHGIDMGLTTEGYIYDASLITGVADFPDLTQLGWATPHSGMSNLIVPAGQFTGFTDDGNPIGYMDLIPLTTSRITVIDAAGSNVLNAGPDRTVLSGRVVMQQPQGDISMGIYQ